MSYTYDYPRPMVTTDIVVFSKLQDRVSILLIKRLNQPYKDNWALPGGFLDIDESLLDCALRELNEETHLNGIELEQLYAFGDPGRDPRGHCVSVVYFGWVTDSSHVAMAGDDAKEVKWFPIDAMPKLAFDHQRIIELAVKKLSL